MPIALVCARYNLQSGALWANLQSAICNCTRKAHIMTTVPDRSGIVYKHHERLYRLALLVGGESDAARLVEQAYRSLPADATDPEAGLARALLPRRRSLRRWRWQARRDQAGRVALDQARADGLIGVLAAMTPAARLI